MVIMLDGMIKEIGKTKKGNHIYVAFSGTDVVRLIAPAPIPDEDVLVNVSILDADNLVFYVRSVVGL